MLKSSFNKFINFNKNFNKQLILNKKFTFSTSAALGLFATRSKMDESLIDVEAKALATQAFLARSDHFVLGNGIDVLDYGCGVGSVSESLQFNAHSIIGEYEHLRNIL